MLLLPAPLVRVSLEHQLLVRLAHRRPEVACSELRRRVQAYLELQNQLTLAFLGHRHLQLLSPMDSEPKLRVRSGRRSLMPCLRRRQ